MKTTTGDIRIRISKQQKDILLNLAQAHGYATLSEYCRGKLFDELTLHEKLNRILQIISGKEEEDKQMQNEMP